LRRAGAEASTPLPPSSEADPNRLIADRPPIESAEIAVSDTGVGIPPEALPRIFERFYRVDGARSREAGGAGLGLCIVKTIAEAHDGRIEVQSTPGVGSTFTVVLPLGA